MIPAHLKYFTEQAEFMNTTVPQNIDRYRKGDFTVRVTDKSGTPIPNAAVSVNHVQHEFKFGANLFMLDEMETPEKNENYRRRFAEVFNTATIPFYWDTLEPEQGKPRFAKDSPRVYRRPATDLCLEYCEANHIMPKLHCLYYDAFQPDWIARDVAGIRQQLVRRFAGIAERYKDSIPWMEVTNELLVPAHCRAYSPMYPMNDNIEWCFAEARKVLPNQKLIINEGASAFLNYCFDRTPYYKQIESALQNGACIDGIGMQYHFWGTRETAANNYAVLANPKFMYQALDTYAKFGLPLHITESTIPCYSDTAEDEQMQAELLENCYRLLFSHPAMEGFIYWNLVDGYAYGATPGDMTKGENVLYGGLLRFDGSPKPAFDAIKKLIHEEWHTEASLKTDGNGSASFRGFFGNYDVTVTANGKTVQTQLDWQKPQRPEQTNEFTVTL